MGKVIYKYQIDEKAPFKITLPLSSKFIKCELQKGCPQMWIEQPIGVSEREDRVFIIHGTGWEIADNHHYLGTYQSEFQNFVWHLYEIVGS